MDPLSSITNALSLYDRFFNPDIFCLIAPHLPNPLRSSISNSVNTYLKLIGCSTTSITIDLERWNTFSQRQQQKIVTAYNEVTVKVETSYREKSIVYYNKTSSSYKDCRDATKDFYSNARYYYLDDFTSHNCHVELVDTNIYSLPPLFRKLTTTRCVECPSSEKTEDNSFTLTYNTIPLTIIKGGSYTIKRSDPSHIHVEGGTVKIESVALYSIVIEGQCEVKCVPMSCKECPCIPDRSDFVVKPGAFFDKICKDYLLSSPEKIVIVGHPDVEYDTYNVYDDYGEYDVYYPTDRPDTHTD